MISAAPDLLRVDRVSLDLGGRNVLHDLCLTLQVGEFLGVIGPNGGGKTTLLRTLQGVFRPNTGSVIWSRVAEGAGRRGCVPQKCEPDRACPFSVVEVLRQGAVGWGPLFGRLRARVNHRIEALLTEVGLEGEAGTRYVELSGGQQRRVLLARALVANPAVLLLDEPTAGVDLDGQEQFAVLLRSIAARGVAVILVSHDLPLVVRHADRIACLNRVLHWHGRAAELPQDVVEDVYGCELQRYRACHPVSIRESRRGEEVRA